MMMDESNRKIVSQIRIAIKFRLIHRTDPDQLIISNYSLR